MNGWTKALVSADPFCRLETSTSNSVEGSAVASDWGRSPEPTARAEVWAKCVSQHVSHHLLKRSAQVRSTLCCPNCCMGGQWARVSAAATQGGRRSKGWPQDRLSVGRGRARETALAALRRPSGLHCPFLGKRHRRETPRQGYTTTTAHTRNHWNSFMLSIFTTQCTSVASRVHMCAVSD